MIEIDYSKAHYGKKDWLELQKKVESNKGKITRWRAATQKDFMEVKRGRLYEGGEPIYKSQGRGMGAGAIYYMKGKGKFKRHIHSESSKTYKSGFYEGYLKGFMKPFKIPKIK